MKIREFLTFMYPEGPWILTAIGVNRKTIETKTFYPHDDVEKWCEGKNIKSNLYFSVNRPNRDLDKKANREDIATVHFLHVDIDARVGELLEEELTRIRELLLERCPVHPPTIIVFSGGGYQAFWRLREPIKINGEIELAEEVSRYNKQLEIVLGGDNCSNVDRIMRLPGTINIPNAKKAERGRLSANAEVVLFRPDAVYSLSDFTPAPKLQTEGLNTSSFTPSANQERLTSVDELDKFKVSDRVKIAIVQGFDPDNPKKGDNSRSSWLFDVCCQLLRSGVPDDLIFSIITDPDFGISSSVLDKGSNFDKYAIRQIERAKDEVEEPWLRKLNDHHIVVGNFSGKCRIIEDVYDPAMRRTRMTHQSFGDFKNRYSNVYVQMGKRNISVGNWWLGHPKRRQVEAVVFSPGHTPPNSYNLWQGFSCNAIPGHGHESLMAHVRDNICCGNDDHYEYMTGWMARTVQHPDVIGETAVVLRGKSGVGKSFFVQQFGSLFGRHFLQVSDAKHLVGSFNFHLRDCVVLFGDEAFYAGDRRHESVLKTLITAKEINIEGKGLDVDPQPNFIHLLLASNAEWVVPSGPMERRFFVLDVGENRQQDNDYFAAIHHAMDRGGRESLLNFLLNYDIKNFNVYKVPSTHALTEQKLHSLEPMDEWWLGRLTEGSLLCMGNGWNSEVVSTELVNDYITYCTKFNVTHRGSEVKLGRFLVRMSPEGWPRRERRKREPRHYVYTFPSLDVLRTHWDFLMGTQTPWDQEVRAAPGGVF